MLAQAPKLAFVRCATMENPPFLLADSSQPSGASGLYADTLNEILTKRMGLSWNCIILPWKRAQAEV